MPEAEVNVITGAFSYTGKYITRRLLALGKQVRTLTGHPNNLNPFGGQVSVYPFHFERPAELMKSLEGATTLYNTYWVRFAHGRTTFDKAVENTITLVKAAEEAGVRRIVHVSITNPTEDSHLPYFRGKAILEKVIQDSRLEHAIIRPTVIFGDEDILINNIAWLLRRFPIFPIFGSGQYSLQPIYVEDMADLVVQAGQGRESLLLDAVGPDIFRFEDLVCLLAKILERRVIIAHVSPRMGLTLARMIEPFIGDVLITRDEIAGLMAGLLVSQQPPMGTTRLEDWLHKHKGSVGKVYASELNRHYR
ncbi:MAG TPA: NAD(P)H-binding protein [Ktedonobacteraceae bacterium]|nr:NAD(P)H-binding protein [Ktedonobacteraceae bacterium]